MQGRGNKLTTKIQNCENQSRKFKSFSIGKMMLMRFSMSYLIVEETRTLPSPQLFSVSVSLITCCNNLAYVQEPHLDTDGVMVDHPAPGPRSTVPLLPPAPGVTTLTRCLIQWRPGAGQVRGAVSVREAGGGIVQVSGEVIIIRIFSNCMKKVF